MIGGDGRMTELTNEEKKVLSGVTFHTEEIEKGELCESDLALLEEMRAVSGYLHEKYPSYSFEITGCEPKAGTIRDYNEWYYKAAEVDRESAFIATAKEQGKEIEILDDFYGEVIREKAQKEVDKVLDSGNIPVINVDISFWEYFGKDFGENISVEKVLKGEIPAGNDIKIFIDDSKLTNKNYQSLLKDVEKCLKTKGICGEVYVVVLKNADGDFAKDRLFSGSVVLD